MAHYYGVIGNRDYIKYHGERRPFWEFLDWQPDGWLTSLVYMRQDLPHDRTMIFDCGAWSYKDQDVPKIGKNLVTPAWALERYISLARPGDFLIAPDHMLIAGVDQAARRAFNIASADTFLSLVGNTPFRAMATVHGENITERIEAALALVRLGYKALAIGGLAARAAQKSLVMSMVLEIRKAVPDVWLHVLGLSSPAYAVAWQEYGIQSFDGSSHFKQAFTGGAFFVREGGRMMKYAAARPGEPVTAPWCECHACAPLREDGIDTRSYGSNESNMGRAAHNLNMLMAAQRAAVFGNTVLVACAGDKLDHAAPAGELYQSTLFKKARRYAKQHGRRWFILSAKHGLLHPDTVIEPYDQTLNTMGATERHAWADLVATQIKTAIIPSNLVVLAGRHYREYLAPQLVAAGYSVEVPMSGLGIGQQLAWLDEQHEDPQQLSLL